MGNAFEVRDATRSDRETLLRFHRSLYQIHREETVAPDVLPLIDYRDYDSVVESDLDSLLSNPSAQVLIAERDGSAIGYITGRTSNEPKRLLSRRAIVEDWYVDPAYRGLGVGAILLRALEDRFRESGCEVLESGTWSANESGRRAHDALGFHEVRITFRKRLDG